MTTAQSKTRAAKPADDEPFDFNLDAVKAESDLTPFRVHFDGRRWEFAHLEGLDIWDVVEAADGGDLQAVLGALRLALGDQYTEFRKIRLPQYKVMALFRAYQRHCGMEPGESEASES
ncbi:hypothetical protein [Streptomyces sp. NRRL F-5630]|uniref:hypothetical protein n=1 Tax=Streptomyces sp. NRRL F-5630 TaxID=1463864 RepID=UPI003D715580